MGGGYDGRQRDDQEQQDTHERAPNGSRIYHLREPITLLRQQHARSFERVSLGSR